MGQPLTDILIDILHGNYVWSQPLSKYAKFSVRVRIRGLEMLVFRKILRKYLMDGLFLECDRWIF